MAATILIVFAGGSTFAGSGTWLTTPVNGDWNTAVNWSSMSVPNGSAATATFDSSSISDVSISANTEVNGIVFSSLAHLAPFTITAPATRTLTISGVGITNNSGVVQNFLTAVDVAGNFGRIDFRNNATAGSMTAFSNTGDQSTGATGTLEFFDASTAGSAVINNFVGVTFFNNTSSASRARFNSIGGATYFNDTASAGSAMFNNNSDGSSRSATIFQDSSTADHATFNNAASKAPGNLGGSTEFRDTSSADSATIIANGVNYEPITEFDEPGFIRFGGQSTAGSATLIANGGSNGGPGGSIGFEDHSTGGTARVELFGNGSLDTVNRDSNAPPLTIGSLEGTGHVFLKDGDDLTVGSNNLSTVFSGVIQDDSDFGSPSSLTKVGTGTLVLSGPNTYAGGTTVNGGVLQVDNKSGSGTGSGPVTVNTSGKLSGIGTIAGDVINNGIVAPGDSPGTLHLGRNYSQGSGGTLDIEIASLLSFDQLIVSGTATLGGTLDVTLDGYTGHSGDVFNILTSSGLTGNFAMIDLPTLSNGLFFRESTTSNDVLLTVSGRASVPDQGSTLLLVAAALAVLLGLQRVWPRLE